MATQGRGFLLGAVLVLMTLSMLFDVVALISTQWERVDIREDGEGEEEPQRSVFTAGLREGYMKGEPGTALYYVYCDVEKGQSFYDPCADWCKAGGAATAFVTIGFITMLASFIMLLLTFFEYYKWKTLRSASIGTAVGSVLCLFLGLILWSALKPNSDTFEGADHVTFTPLFATGMGIIGMFASFGVAFLLIWSRQEMITEANKAGPNISDRMLVGVYEAPETQEEEA